MRPVRLLIAAAAGAAVGAPLVLAAAGARLEAAARRELAALAARGVWVRDVRWSWFRPFRLEGVAVSGGGREVWIDAAEVAWGLRGAGQLRAHVRGLRLRGVRLGQGPLGVVVPELALDVVAWTRESGVEGLRLRQAGSGGGAEVRWPAAPAGSRSVSLQLAALDLSAARVSWQGESVLDPGRWSGRVTIAGAGDRLESEGVLSGEGVRLVLPRALGAGNGRYGAPTGIALDWHLRRENGHLEVRRAGGRLAGLDFSGRGRLRGSSPRAELEVQLSAQSDLAAMFRTAGFVLPASLRALDGGRFGTAAFDVSLQGPPADPGAMRILPRLRFESAPEAVAALRFLRRPFRYRPAASPGVVLDVREGAPGFVPLAAVPQPFVEALLLSEDAGFFGHPGVDVAEIPAAWARNAERGTLARGASTITQQLVKNLFLSGEKSYGRKLAEAALALVLDAAVPKTRQLEIYLNVVEWGPGVHGVGPAAQHYFGKLPHELTAKETAFLVCLIPSPVRYHQAHAAGRVGPGMEALMANLLDKLHATGRLTDAEHAAALAETLAFRPC